MPTPEPTGQPTEEDYGSGSGMEEANIWSWKPGNYIYASRDKARLAALPSQDNDELCCNDGWGQEGPGCCSTECRDYVKEHNNVWYWHQQSECPRICWDGCPPEGGVQSGFGAPTYNYGNDNGQRRRRLDEINDKVPRRGDEVLIRREAQLAK